MCLFKTKNLITNNTFPHFSLHESSFISFFFFNFHFISSLIFLYLPTYFFTEMSMKTPTQKHWPNQWSEFRVGLQYLFVDQWQWWKPVRKRSLFL